jgi:multiple sugar transport system permease protein
MSKYRHRKRFHLGRLVFGSALAFLFFLPLLYTVISGIKPVEEIFTVPVRWIPSRIALENFVEPMRYGHFGRYFLNSFVVAVAVTSSAVFFCSLGGYSLSKYSFRGHRAFFIGVLITMMVPIETILVPLAVIVKKVGMMDSLAGLIVPVAITPFGVFWMRQYLVTLPNDYIDAARIDGLGEFQIFLHMILPLSVPAVGALTIFVFMGNWNSFIWPLIVTKRAVLRTIPVGLVAFRDELGARYHYMFAMATLAILPTAVIFAILRTRLVKGLTMIGIKG